ncbi:MAG: hypothetical protein JNL80_18810, partial [Phycisphaerae bacterium]|nr:hypothetical protein [Phycisphaerae bacterium]
MTQGASTAPSPMKAAGARQHPPHAPLAFRVGVIGHRWNRLGSLACEPMRQALTEILSAVRSTTESFADLADRLYEG